MSGKVFLQHMNQNGEIVKKKKNKPENNEIELISAILDTQKCVTETQFQTFS